MRDSERRRSWGLFLWVAFGIVLPGVVLGGLSLAGLERDRLAEERLLGEKHLQAAEDMNDRLREAVEKALESMEMEVSGLRLESVEELGFLEALLDDLIGDLPAVKRFFVISGDTWEIVSAPSPVPMAPGEQVTPGRKEVDAALRVEDPKERAEALLSLSGTLIDEALREEVSTRLAAEIREDFEGIIADVAARYENMVFRSRYTLEIRDRIRDARGAAPQFPVQWETAWGEGAPILYGTLPLVGPSPRYYLGFVFDLDILREETLPPLIDAAERAGMLVLVTDHEGKRVAGVPPGDFLLATFSTGMGLPRWTITVAGDHEDFDMRYRSRRATLIGLVSVLALAIVAGAIWTVRGVHREMEAARIKSDFVASVSHELRTPLTSIRMFSDMIRTGRAPTEEKRKSYAETISQQSERLGFLINNILDFSRLEQGMPVGEKTPAPMGDVVMGAVDSFRSQMTDAGFELVTEIGEGLPTLEVDSEGIGRAVINLLGNAMKYSHGDKRVTLRVLCEDDQVRIEVEDRGRGIAPKDCKRIFDRFYRGEGVRGPGSGIGLAIVKAIVSAHGGEVQVESEVGKGSTFTIILPAPGG